MVARAHARNPGRSGAAFAPQVCLIAGHVAGTLDARGIRSPRPDAFGQPGSKARPGGDDIRSPRTVTSGPGDNQR